MPGLVTEVALIPVQPGVDIEDEGSPAYQIWQESLTTISQQKGYQRACYGPVVENPSLIQLLVDWDSYEAHKEFIDSYIYAEFITKFTSIMSFAPKFHHLQPSTCPPTVFTSAPVIEMATFFKAEAGFLENVMMFVARIKDQAEGALDFVYGPVIEDIENRDGDGEGRAVMLCIGWESKDAHMRFRESKTFADNIELLRKGLGGAEMHHTSYRAF